MPGRAVDQSQVRRNVEKSLNKQEKLVAFDQQIADLLSKAAERPGPNDSMGMVGFAATLLAANMFVKSETLKLAEQKAKAPDQPGQ